jgi:peptidoglycan/LPS O-acetylase OafA/YrhL
MIDREHTRAENHQHLPGLDGLRGLAILVVMLHHFLPPNFPVGIPGGAAGVVVKAFYRVFDLGWWGVDLFFALSGFLITGILLKAKGAEHYFGSFYMRRTLRIFPLYYGVLVFVFFIVPWLASTPATAAFTSHYAADLLSVSRDNASSQGWLWLYGTNLKIALSGNVHAFGELTHFWSLAVEEHFYFIWPFVVFCCSTVTLARVCLVLALSSLLCRAGCIVGGMEGYLAYFLSPCRFDGLALGAFVAAVGQLWTTGRVSGAAASVSGAPGVWSGLRLLFRVVPPADASRELLRAICSRLFVWLAPITALALLVSSRFGSFTVIIGHTLLACTFASCLPAAAAALNQGPLLRGRWLYFRPLQTLGKLSYGLYVLHPFAKMSLSPLLAMEWAVRLTGGTYAGVAIFRLVVGIFFSLLLAGLSWHLFEKHLLKLNRYFPASKARSSAPVPANPVVSATLPSAQ